MMVEHGGARVEAARVPGILEFEPLVIEVMAELVAERAEERSEGGDLFADGRPHPDANQFRSRIVVAEQFGTLASLTNLEWAGRQHANLRRGNPIKF